MIYLIMCMFQIGARVGIDLDANLENVADKDLGKEGIVIEVADKDLGKEGIVIKVFPWRTPPSTQPTAWSRKASRTRLAA